MANCDILLIIKACLCCQLESIIMYFEALNSVFCIVIFSCAETKDGRNNKNSDDFVSERRQEAAADANESKEKFK